MQPAARTPCITLLALLAAGCATHRPAVDANAARQTNTLGMVFVRIPAGSFRMGTAASVEELQALYPDAEPRRLQGLGDETPAHVVRITRPFYLGQHEVTVGQFRAFLSRSSHVPESVADGTGGYGWNPDYDPATTARGDAFEGRDPRYAWRNPGFAQGDNHPVVNVTWNDAQALAQWLSRSEGRRYRLPTEAEWEYACRAGQQGGEPAPSALQGKANVFDRDAAVYWSRWASQAFAFRDGHAFTAPVGSFAANAFGLHDMVGNVWEWTADWHGDDYYARSPVDDPQGPAEGEVKVRRGGSWHTWPLYARCGFRNWNTPGTRYTLVGIRLVLEAP
jgi:sulfatase modifying factor 1